MRNKLFLFAVIVIVFSLAVFAPVKKILYEAGVWAYTDIGNVKEAEKPSDDTTVSRIKYAAAKVEAEAENIYTNFLPYYNDVVMLSGDLEYKVNDAFDSLFENHDNTVMIETIQTTEHDETAEVEVIEQPDETSEDLSDKIVSVESKYISSDGRHLYYTIKASYGNGDIVNALERVTACTEEELDEKMKPRIEEMVRIVKYLSENANVVVYAGSRFQDFPVVEDIIEGSYSTGEDLSEFLSALEPYAKTGFTDLSTVQDRFDKMLLTDHHWNLYGADEAYRSIVGMLSESFTEIGEPRDGVVCTVDGIKHNGSFSRLANYYRFSEGFSFFDYDLPEHKASGGALFDDCKNLYLSGQFDNSRGVTHYENFYPAHASITYDNDTGHNLLVIGDSFSRAVNEVLASHFDHTYIHQYYSGGMSDLEAYLKRYKITDVVILIYSDRLMYNLWDDFELQDYITP